MKRLGIVASMFVLAVLVGTSYGKNPTAPSAKRLTAPPAGSAANETPEMWFYEQYMQMYQDPKAMIRMRAEAEAAERTRRIEAMHWYGMSNQRPRVGTDPYNSDYAPHWVSGDNLNPNRWPAYRPIVIFAPMPAAK